MSAGELPFSQMHMDHPRKGSKSPPWTGHQCLKKAVVHQTPTREANHQGFRTEKFHVISKDHWFLFRHELIEL